MSDVDELLDGDPEPANPKAVGEISEALVLSRLVQLGYGVALPFGNNQRYDFIVDDGENLRRVQVKTGRLRKGNVVFATRSSSPYSGQRGYLGEADDFVVYCPDTNEIYRVPVAECGHMRHCYLRVDDVRPGTRTAVRWANDHVFAEAVTPDGKIRKARPDRFAACSTTHPGKPPRIKEKFCGQGRVRWYCMECHLHWSNERTRRRRAERPDTSAATSAGAPNEEFATGMPQLPV